MLIKQQIGRIIAVHCIFLLLISCEKDAPAPPIENSSCDLKAFTSTVLGMETLDSVYYTDGKVVRITQHSANAPTKTINYSYYGQDSVHISENGSLSTVYYFDALSRLTEIRYITNGQTLQFQYTNAGTAGDSIRLSMTGEPSAFATLFRNTQGNITYARSVIEGDLHESHYTYDTKANVFKPLLHFGNLLYALSRNNQLRYTTYKNGVLVETVDFNLSYTASNQLSSMAFMEGAFRFDFKYECR